MGKIEITKRVFNPVFYPLLENKDRFLVLYGGAGSGKSFFVAQRIIYHMLKDKMMNLLVIRAVAKDNRDSTFAMIKQIAYKWGLLHLFKFNATDLRIRCISSGNEIIFSGLDDVENRKSVTFQRGELTDIWIEEASQIDEDDFNQLDLRLRGLNVEGQMVLSFNPINVNHWLKKTFFDFKSTVKKEDCTVLHTTYKDNIFIDEKYKERLEARKDIDPYYYSVYCLGQWGVYGSTVFDAANVSQRLDELQPPLKTGAFFFETKEFDINGDYIKIYKEPVDEVPYVIGADTAGEGSDYSVAQVLDNTTGEQVATLRIQNSDEDLFAQQLYCLGLYYNTALISIEANFSTFPIKELQRLGYEFQYTRKKEDTFTGKTIKSYGFKTTSVTRPIIISELVTIVRETPELINDKDTLDEMLTFVRNERGRPEAQVGTHDDCIMALAIAYYSRNQQAYTIDKPHHDSNLDEINSFLRYG